MKRIFIVCDVKDWAIDRLSQSIIKHNPHFEFNCYYLHPRDVKEKIGDFKKAVKEFKPDVIHFQYYRSCSQALELWPEIKKYKIILTHHNQRTKAVYSAQWIKLGVDCLVTHTKKCADMLASQGERNIAIIQHGIDLNYFTYSDKEPEEPRIGYVGRIVPWKGLLEICKAAKELGHKVLVMGRLDKADYWKQIEEYKDVVDFTYFDCKDEERIEAYRNMTVFVNNSIDGYEEGPLPYLEAMACGVPVITTLSGEARDLVKEDENALMIPFKEEKKSYDNLKNCIDRLMKDKILRQQLRDKGWSTIKSMDERKMAREYSSLYYKVGDERPLVSVVIPATYERQNEVHDILKGLKNQTYKNIEVIIIWDEFKWEYEDQGIPYQNPIEDTRISIKELYTEKGGYNLAMARNMGVIEAEGDYIMFNDSRLCPESDAIEKFLEATSIPAAADVWFFGDKGASKKSFVENFSFVDRKALVSFGGFNERITGYGGMSQDIRTRWRLQGNILYFAKDAKAKQLVGSGKDAKKRKDIINMKLLLFKLYKGLSF